MNQWLHRYETAAPRLQQRYTLGLLLVITLLFYGNSIGNRFAIDDEYVTNTNPENVDNPVHPSVAKGFAGIPEIWTQPYVQIGEQRFDYRPIVVTTFAIEYAIFRGNPHWSHFFNVLLYLLNCLLLFRLLRMLFKEQGAILALLITVLFVIHPIHTEVVNNLKSRDELLVLTGGLFALIHMLKLVDRFTLKSLLWVMLGLAFAFLSKRTSSVFIGVFPLVILFYKPKSWKYVLGGALAVVFAGVLMRLGTRMSLEDGATRVLRFYENPLIEESSLGARFSMAGYTSFWYFKQMLLPIKLVSYYGYNALPISGWSNALVWLGLLIHGGLAVFAATLWKRRHPIALGLFWYLGIVLIYSNLVKPVVGIVADRFAYAGSVGVCIVMGWLLWKWLETRRASKKSLSPLLFVLLVLTTLAGVRTLTRNAEWKDKASLLAADVKEEPESVKLNAMYGDVLTDYNSRFVAIRDSLALRNQQLAAFAQQNGQAYQPVNATPEMLRYIDLKIKHYRKAVEVAPDYKYVLNNLGQVYIEYKGNYDSAVYFFQQALLTDSTFYQAQLNEAICYERTGAIRKAESAYRKAMGMAEGPALAEQKLMQLWITQGEFERLASHLQQKSEGSTQLWDDYMAAWMTAGQFDPAIGLAKAILRVAPEHRVAYSNLVKLYHNQGEKEKAIAVAKASVEQFPQDKEGYQQCSNLLLQYERYDEAIIWNKNASAIFPQEPFFLVSVGDVHHRIKGDFATALRWYQKAHELTPNDSKLCAYLARVCIENDATKEAEVFQQCAKR